MDLNLVTIAQRLPDNQFGFDRQAINRAPVHPVPSRRCAQTGTIGAYLTLISRMATPRRAR